MRRLGGDRALAIARKETRELLRDPAYLGLAVVVPVLLILVLGYQLSLDVKGLLVAVVDRDRSRWSREYIDGLVNSEYFRLVGALDSAEEAREWIRSGRARVVVDIPPDFGRRLSAGEPATVGVTVDGSFPSRGQIGAAYVAAINSLYNERLLREYLARHGAGDDRSWPVQMELAVWYNPTLESKNFIVPGMLVVILMIFPPLLSALLIVRERESGTILNLYCSPAGRWDILAGKALPYVGVSFLDFLLIFAASLWLFRVRFVGTVWMLVVGALLYSVCTVGLGLLISAVTRSQLAAMLATFLGAVAPAFTFSGIFTPTASLDAVGRFVSRLIPATYFMDVVRGSYLKGGGVAPYLPSLAILTLYAVVIYGAAWLALRKRLG
ncbi:MAG TPA: ABC transporter permease [Methylomirabilota bacterium]|nr:ABC transporter permease [Methylomirabilota bacterium]